jgi:hypothetical protein
MPKMIALCICARTVSGLTTVPQSTAQTTRRTRTAPSLAGVPARYSSSGAGAHITALRGAEGKGAGEAPDLAGGLGTRTGSLGSSRAREGAPQS